VIELGKQIPLDSRGKSAVPIRHVTPVYFNLEVLPATSSRTFDLDPSAPKRTSVNRLVPSSKAISVSPSSRLDIEITRLLKCIGIPASLTASCRAFCNLHRRIAMLCNSSSSSSVSDRTFSSAATTSVPSCLYIHETTEGMSTTRLVSHSCPRPTNWAI
jgi:hypothetical protein